MRHPSAIVALVLAWAVAVFTGPPATAKTKASPRAQVRMTPQDPGTASELFGVAFPDGQDGHAVGTNGVILATTDGGTTWRPQDGAVKTGTDGHPEVLTGVSFPDPLHGHAVGSDGTILATTDGGGSWTDQEPPPGGIELRGVTTGWSFRAVSFSDAEHGVIVGGAAVLTTSDGGASWNAFGDPKYGSLMNVSAVDALHAQVVAWAGQEQGIPFVTIATSDGGRTFQPHAVDLGPGVDNLNFNAVSFTDVLNGHAVGGQGRIVATSDGGQNWRLERSGGGETLTGVAFAGARRGVVVGTVSFTTGAQQAVVFATEDGGQTWTSRIVPDTVRLRGGVDFSTPDTAYAVGCRRNDPNAQLGRDDVCAEGAVVRIDFLAPAQPPASRSPWRSWPLITAFALALVGLAALAARWRARH